MGNSAYSMFKQKKKLWYYRGTRSYLITRPNFNLLLSCKFQHNQLISWNLETYPHCKILNLHSQWSSIYGCVNFSCFFFPLNIIFTWSCWVSFLPKTFQIFYFVLFFLVLIMQFNIMPNTTYQIWVGLSHDFLQLYLMLVVHLAQFSISMPTTESATGLYFFYLWWCAVSLWIIWGRTGIFPVCHSNDIKWSWGNTKIPWNCCWVQVSVSCF